MAQHDELNRPYTFDSDLEAKIQALTPEQINAAFKRHIDPNGLSIVKAGDFKAAACSSSSAVLDGSTGLRKS